MHLRLRENQYLDILDIHKIKCGYFLWRKNGAENQLAQDNQRDRRGARMEAYSVPDLHSTCRGTGAQGRHCGPQLSPISSEQLMEPLTGQRGRLKGKNWPPSQLQRAGSALRSCKNTVFGLKDVQSRYALGHSQQDRDRVIQRSGQNHIQKMKTKMNTHWVSLQFQNIVEETQ